ncbi:hypothetical protein B0H63DRAFT_474291 [Podospora didyma]|uniref:DUF8021 domain-containing protein n=1 Tax=Podospora didyma TaxID=330526 RepID=A0AAE0NR82_9PEZI|nr:hypothetical protein B0H63DRAFT_474291 [Podospora didyma]
MGIHANFTMPLSSRISTWVTLGVVVATGNCATVCDRETLRAATNRYLIAQSTGQVGWLQSALATNATYWENLVKLDITNSTLSQSLRVDYSRTSIDTTQCATYTELIATDARKPYTIAMQLRFDPSSSKITKLDGIVTTTGDFYFNASHALHYALREDWSPISTEKQDSRAALQAAADAYYDVFVDKTVKVPWGTPCTRLEGGYLDADGDCNTDIPDVTIHTVDRRYVIDETLGTVDVISNFGILGPDSHEFRIVNGTIRAIHSMTLCRPNFNCGVAMPDILSQDIGF